MFNVYFLHVIALLIRLDISGAVLALSVKTSSRNAVLAYNAGTANSNDFVAVEVKNITITTLTKSTANTLKL